MSCPFFFSSLSSSACAWFVAAVLLRLRLRRLLRSSSCPCPLGLSLLVVACCALGRVLRCGGRRRRRGFVGSARWGCWSSAWVAWALAQAFSWWDRRTLVLSVGLMARSVGRKAMIQGCAVALLLPPHRLGRVRGELYGASPISLFAAHAPAPRHLSQARCSLYPNPPPRKGHP